MKNNDKQLIQRTLDGDDSAFAELVEKYQKQVHALVWRKIGDFHIAEEITQDTFLRAYQKLGTLKKPQRFASWLYVIAANRCNTWLEKKHLRKQLLEDKDIAQSDETTYSEYVLEENERITVETQRDVVKKLLAKLGESERTVMTLALLWRDVVCGDRCIHGCIGKYGEESAPPRAAASTKGGNDDKRGFRQFQNHSESYGKHHARDFADQTRDTVR